MLAGVYGRISILKDAAREVETSVARQFRDCLAWVERQGGKVVRTYRDDGFSAFTGDTRPDFERLLEDLEQGVINTVVCWKLDRLVRNHADFQRLWEACERHGARLVSLHEMFDSSTPAGEFTVRLMVGMAKMESANISLRVQRYLESAATAGLPHAGGSRPFGYRRGKDKNEMEVVPEEAAVLIEAANRILAGESLRGITRDLNRRGVVGTRGAPLRIASLAGALTSARVAGLVERDGEIIGPGKWEPILDRATWEQVRKILRDPERRKSPGPERRHLLSGFVACGRPGCGFLLYNRPITGKSSLRGRHRYMCFQGDRAGGSPHLVVHAEPLEAVIEEALLQRYDAPGLGQVLAGQEQNANERELAEQLAADDQALVELGHARFVERSIGHGAYLAAKAELDERITKARQHLDRIAARRQLKGVPMEPHTLRKAWPKLSLQQKRAVLGLVLEKVVILPATHRGRRFDDKRVDPHWRA
jgi:DNA invertase Pin-like site-specific DNA recombinase